jgi:hypothetical protein
MSDYLTRQRPQLDEAGAAERIRRFEAGEHLFDIYPPRPAGDSSWGLHDWFLGYLHRDQKQLGKELTR